ncbi:MAG: SpaA isopeptide-forming pilin-related protein [Candidatus Coprovivens sp.]
MEQQRKLTSIIIYLLVLFFSISGFVFALHSSVIQGYNQVTNKGGSNSQDGVEVSKTIAETDLENYFDITLTVKTQTKIEEIIKAQDIAVVIVMDISNTMTSNDMVGSTTTRVDEAKSAAKSFITRFQEEASASDATAAKRQIGFVTFATSSYEVFGLSDCKTTTQRNNMISQVDSITTKTTDERFTNMEAGLSRAKDMLNDSQIQNKYIIFLTDGLPTTYSKTIGGYTGYNPQDPSLRLSGGATPTQATPGVFYNFDAGMYVSAGLGSTYLGTNYSDLGARRAENVINSLKQSGVSIYTIGIGINKQPSLFRLRYTQPQESGLMTMDSDYENNNYAYYGNRYYAVTPGLTKPLNNAKIDNSIRYEYETNCTTYYKKWLQDYMSSGSGYYYDSSQSGSIVDAYGKIFEGIKQMTEESSQATWVAEDPMGVDGNIENIEFVGFFDDTNEAENLQDSLTKGITNQSDTASTTNGTIKWDLKNSTYEETKENNITTYFYSIKYRIRLENEITPFSTSSIYNTNGTTKLTYVIRNNGVLSENKTIEFPIPKVVGYLGNLSFTKKASSFDNLAETTLAGAKFTLTHDANCPCLNEDKTHNHHMATNQTYEATSTSSGTVTFNNIPSGHKYILKETEAPSNYNPSSDVYEVEVAYGVTTGGPNNGVIYNSIKNGNLKISKLVEGNKDYSGEFEFKLTVKYNATTLTGSYNYTLYHASTNTETQGSINLLNDTFKLKDGDYIIIKGLPITSQYEVKELTTNGYVVKNKINSGDRVTSALANCNDPSCSIKNGSTQEVTFYNIAGYILPATGKSGMLILLIIASLLLIVPVINIGYMLYKNRKEDKLTS